MLTKETQDKILANEKLTMAQKGLLWAVYYSDLENVPFTVERLKALSGCGDSKAQLQKIVDELVKRQTLIPTQGKDRQLYTLVKI